MEEGPTVGERLAFESVRARMLGATPPMRSIGRYVISASLGRGGMAEVFVAFDPQLRRDVALKVVSLGGRRRRSRRIMREAQAQAQLSHPNVVAVYDVGIAEDDVYIAMELVRGESLREWLAHKRSCDEVLAKFLAAAQGLIAAHEVGLVHRDFKPSNVLIATDGVAKVADFGLAVQSHDTDSSSMPAKRVAELDRRLTQTGYTFGTPLYMAPEQHRAQRLDAGADQYAFCASLLEALTGDMPFRSTTMTKLLEEKSAGPPRVPVLLDVPRRVIAALRRGLEPDRRRRWSSMRALVDALQGKRRRLAWWMLPVGASVAAIAWASGPANDTCDAEARLREAWGEDAQEELRVAIDDAQAWEHLHASLDAYAQSWVAAYDEACASVDGPDPRLQCLQARQRRFGALTRTLAQAGPEVLDTIDASLTELEPPHTCLDPANAEAIGEPDAEWVAIDGLLAESNAALVSTQIDRGRELASEALSRAQAIGDRRLEAEAIYQLGLVDTESDRFLDALPQLERAYFMADEIGDDKLAALAAAKLVWSIAEGGRADAELERWQQHAVAHLQHVDDKRTHASVHLSLSTMQHRLGEYSNAAESAAKSVAAFEEVYGKQHPGVASALNNRGLALVSAGRMDEALPVLQRAADIYEKTLGKLAPRRAYAVLNIGLCLYEMGRYSEAAAVFDEVLEMTRAQARAQPSVSGRALSNKGLCLLELGDTKGALAAFLEARELILGSLGEAHPLVPLVEMNIALTYHYAQDFTAAVDAYERARTAQVEVLGADHPQTARTEYNLGVTLSSLGQFAEAAERLRGAKATFEKTLGVRSELAALATMELARAEVGLGNAAEGLRLAETSHSLLVETAGPDSRWVVFAILYKGTALRELGRVDDAREAFDEASRKLAALRDPDPSLARDLEIEREKLPTPRTR